MALATITGFILNHIQEAHLCRVINYKRSIEYCNGYRAGAVGSDVNDDPDENITASKVTCQGSTPSSQYCHGYQQGYADEDHAMFSPSLK